MPDRVEVVDMMGRKVEVNLQPKRIVSLVPSQTEFLIDIGVPLVGRTKFCIHPSDKVKDIPVVGGTKKFRFDVIDDLQPDLIIGNKEENYKEGIEELARTYPVWMSDIYSLSDSFKMMSELGDICERKNESANIIDACRNATNRIKASKSGRALYLIWKNPWMAAGKNTFIDHMLSHLGYENAVEAERYAELSEEAIRSLNPDLIFLSSEPFPFKDKHLDELSKIWPESECRLVDGELYSWYGSRLRHWIS